jgi:hypothetical protein
MNLSQNVKDLTVMTTLGRVFACLSILPWCAFAQVPISQLQPANGKINASFPKQPLDETLMFRRTIQELSNGKVLISQTDGEQRILADFSNGTFEEQKNFPAGQLIALPADSSIAKGFETWTILHNLRPLGQIGLERARRLVNPLLYETVHAADGTGRLLIEQWSTTRDSIVVSFVDRVTGSRDTVAKLWRDPPPARGGFRPVCKQTERIALAPDGWVAVLRANPYRVDWRRPNGEWVRGRSLQETSQPMTDADRAVYLEWRRDQRPPPPSDTVREWPAHTCAWTWGFTPKATPDGFVLVYRVPTSAVQTTLYDVIDRRGVLVRQLQLPGNEAIFAFGKESIYVVRTIGDKQELIRHPWPKQPSSSQ